MRIETIASRSRLSRQPGHPVTAAINTSATFVESPGTDDHYYGVFGNPNRDMLEDALRDIEGGDAACAFPSGSAALMAVLLGLQRPSHIIAPFDVFQGSARMLKHYRDRLGLETSFIDMQDLAQLRRAIRSNTALILAESPTNPMLRVLDLSAIVKVAHRNNIIVAVDNTMATAFLQRPLQLGCDIVINSTTKSLSGHGDLIGGAVVSRGQPDLAEAVRAFQQFAGAIPSPFDCWLLLRSLESSAHRIRAQSDSALALAQWLAANIGSERVYYPGLPDHHGHATAKMQMEAFGPVLSFELPPSHDSDRFRQALRLWTSATSFGSANSLIEQRARSPIQRTGEGSGFAVPQSLFRLSVGLENVRDLRADLQQALVCSAQ